MATTAAAVRGDDVGTIENMMSQLRATRGSAAPRGAAEVRAARGDTVNNAVKELEGYDYSIEKKIQLRLNNHKRIFLLRSCTAGGFGCYVDVNDGDNVIAVDPATLTAREAGKANVFGSLSEKRGVMDLVGNDAPAFIRTCVDGLCMVEQKTEEEHTFIYESTKRDENLRLGEDPISYPVVRLSDIRKAPGEVEECIRRITLRLRASTFGENITQFEQTEIAVDAEHKALRQARDTFKEYMHSTADCIELHEKFMAFHIRCPPTKDTELAKKQETAKKLKCLNELMNDLLRTAARINSQRQIIMQSTAEICDAIAYMEKIYGECCEE